MDANNIMIIYTDKYEIVKMKLIFFILSISLSVSLVCQKNQISYAGNCWNDCPNDTAFTFKDGAYTCEQCDLTRYLVFSQETDSCTCAKQTYIHMKTQQCTPCHYTCLTCKGPSYDDCVTCDANVMDTNRVWIGGACLCKTGYFDDQSLQSLKCHRCHRDCQTCSGVQDNQCIKCQNGKVKDQFGYCICPNGYIDNQAGNCICPFPLVAYPDGSCKNPTDSCGYNQQPVKPYNIANVAKGSKPEQNCACKPGFAKIKGKCDVCKQNQIYNSKNGNCECPKNGFKVKKNCIICPDGQTFNRKTGECNCKKNQTMTETKACIKCPPKTVYQLNKCTCIFNYYMESNGKCKKCNRKSDNPLCSDYYGVDTPKKLQASDIKGNQM